LQKKEHPKAFISYSWTSTEFAIALAERLRNDGIDAIIDKWDLSIGNDKHAFMESMVTDDSIDYVLMLCDKTYKDKADSRTGGVGEEAQIISSEVYGKVKQSKFIPVIVEKDENGKEYTPVYLKSLIYVDLSQTSDYETNYEELLRMLYEEPLYKKPELGKKPVWLSENSVNINILNNIKKSFDNSTSETKALALKKQFISNFVEKAKEIIIECNSDNVDIFAEEIISKIDATKELRDTYLSFINSVIENDESNKITDFIIDFFETTRNSLYLFDGSRNVKYNLELYATHHTFLLWECFVCTIAYLWNYEKYLEINKLLTHTYFLKSDVNTYDGTEPLNFLAFRFTSNVLNSYSAHKQTVSIVSDIISKRPYEPIINKKTFSYADVLITQLSFALEINEADWYWFAITYNNLGMYGFEGMWNKLQSREYCNKLLPLFGVDTVDKLIEVIKQHPVPREYCYPGMYLKIPSIPTQFKENEIASLR
jgi:hypothetical protein